MRRYSSQNRLRLPQFNEMFEGIGFNIVKGECMLHSGDEEIIKKMKLANMFKYLTQKQLAISSARLVYATNLNRELLENVIDRVVFFQDKFEDENI